MKTSLGWWFCFFTIYCADINQSHADNVNTEELERPQLEEDDRAIAWTSNFLEFLEYRNKEVEVSTVTAWGLEWEVLSNVFLNSPEFSSWFEKPIASEGDIFLEIGTGHGLYACKAALDGAELVVATDINPYAIKNVLLNAKKHNIDKKCAIIAFESDIFNNEKLLNYKFDKILWNIPYVYRDGKTIKIEDLTLMEKTCYDPGYQLLERYLSQGKKYLNKGGKLYIAWSKELYTEHYLRYVAWLYEWDMELYENMILKMPQGVDIDATMSMQMWQLTPRDERKIQKDEL